MDGLDQQSLQGLLEEQSQVIQRVVAYHKEIAKRMVELPSVPTPESNSETAKAKATIPPDAKASPPTPPASIEPAVQSKKDLSADAASQHGIEHPAPQIDPSSFYPAQSPAQRDQHIARDRMPQLQADFISPKNAKSTKLQLQRKSPKYIIRRSSSSLSLLFGSENGISARSLQDFKGVLTDEMSQVSFGHGSDSLGNFPVLSPESTFVKVWITILYAAAIYAIVLAPFEMSFHWWSPPKVYKYIGYALDVYFMLDVLLHFNTAIIHHGHVVTDRKSIAIHYAQTFLLVDVASNIPYDWFVGSGGKGRKLVKLIKLPKIIRFVRLMRVVKKETRYVGTSLTIVAMLLAAHYFACIWNGIFLWDCDADSVCPPIGQTYMEGISISMSSFAGNYQAEVFLGSHRTSWLAAMRHEGERGSVLIYMVIFAMYLVGYVLLACLFANVALMMQATSAEGRKHAADLKHNIKEMEYAKVPRWLQKKVCLAYKYMWRMGGGMDGMLRDPALSLDLRRTLALSVHGEALRSVPLFCNTSENNLKILAEKAELRIFTPGDYLTSKGQVENEIFVIVKGFVQAVNENENENENEDPAEFEQMGPGDVVGEACFLDTGVLRRRSSLRSLQCIGFCRCLMLPFAALEELNLLGEGDNPHKQAMTLSPVVEEQEAPSDCTHIEV